MIRKRFYVLPGLFIGILVYVGHLYISNTHQKGPVQSDEGTIDTNTAKPNRTTLSTNQVEEYKTLKKALLRKLISKYKNLPENDGEDINALLEKIPKLDISETEKLIYTFAGKLRWQIGGDVLYEITGYGDGPAKLTSW